MCIFWNKNVKIISSSKPHVITPAAEPHVITSISSWAPRYPRPPHYYSCLLLQICRVNF